MRPERECYFSTKHRGLFLLVGVRGSVIRTFTRPLNIDGTVLPIPHTFACISCIQRIRNSVKRLVTTNSFQRLGKKIMWFSCGHGSCRGRQASESLAQHNRHTSFDNYISTTGSHGTRKMSTTWTDASFCAL